MKQYDKLRVSGGNPVKILVLLQLPKNEEEWLNVTPDQLLIKRCARWVSLRGAPSTANKASKTVYIPKSQIFSPQALRDLGEAIAGNRIPTYAGDSHG